MLYSSGEDAFRTVYYVCYCGLICVVVVWCDMLGALHWRQDSLSRSGPSHPPQFS